MPDPNAIGVDISRLVQNSPNHQILGSALAVLLRRGYPEFRPEDFGCRNLRDFIRKYSKEVFEYVRRGTDVVYSAALLPTMAEASTRQQEFRAISAEPRLEPSLRVSTPVWKTFVSPNAYYRIFANRETGEMRVVTKHEEAPDVPWMQLPSASADTHIQIAKDFVESLAEESVKTELTKILGLDSWWNHFFVSARGFGVERQWSAFRRRRLHSEFERQLKSSGVPLPVSSKPSSVAPQSVVPEGPLAGAEADDAVIRRVAAAVIRRLPLSELRDVWLPLGYVLDELGDK